MFTEYFTLPVLDRYKVKADRLSTTRSNGSMSLVTMLSTQWKYLNFSVWTNHALVVTNNGLDTIHQYNGYGYTGLCTGYQMNQNQPLY